MTTVTGSPDRAIRRLPYTHSTNGTGPAAPPTPRLLAVVGIAFVLGVVVAKVIDWRTHAHPRY